MCVCERERETKSAKRERERKREIERERNKEGDNVGGVRAAPLVRVQVKFTAKKRHTSEALARAFGYFDCEFGFDSHEWSCS